MSRWRWLADPFQGPGIQRCTSGCPVCDPEQANAVTALVEKTGFDPFSDCEFHFDGLLLPVVTVSEYSLPRLKSRRRLPGWLPVPLRYREALENSPGIRPQLRGSPQRSAPPLRFH